MAGLEKRLIGLIVAAAVFGWFAVLPVQASTVRESRQAQKNYEKNDYQAAADTYQKGLTKSPESDVLNFGMGTTLYKQEKYPEAIQHLEKSLLSPNPDLQAMGQYNLGNSLYRDGIRQENTNIEQAVQQLEKSLDHYTSALKHNDKDEDAKYNYDFVKKELERLKEKLKKEQQKKSSSKDQSQQKSNDQQKQDEKKDQNQEQNQNQQDKSSSGSENKPQDQQSQQQQQSNAGDQQKQDQQDQQNQKQQKSPEDSSGNDQQEKGDDSSGEKQSQEIDKPASGTESNSSQDGNIPRGQLSPGEARGLLENYQNNEEPKGFLNFMKNKGQESPVLNDW